jgi:hypothetical protein
VTTFDSLVDRVARWFATNTGSHCSDRGVALHAATRFLALDTICGVEFGLVLGLANNVKETSGLVTSNPVDSRFFLNFGLLIEQVSQIRSKPTKFKENGP